MTCMTDEVNMHCVDDRNNLPLNDLWILRANNHVANGRQSNDMNCLLTKAKISKI